MKRKIMEKLINWKNKKQDRLPLIIYGARQVGKTYILTEFAQNSYKDYVYINFEQMDLMRDIFNNIDLIPDKLIKEIENYTRKKITPEQTLIILDEIQTCERALTSLKYFAEQAPEYHIVCAGSLLGVAINRMKFSFPVGKVEMLNLSSLDFEEFLMANNEEQLILDIRNGIQTNEPLLEYKHNRALELFKQYLITGGMPAVIKQFIQTNSFEDIRYIQENILNSYIADMAKYATATETTKIRLAYDSIPVQLSKDNKKFQYKLIKKGASTSNFGVAIEWLELARIIIKCKKVTNIEKPLEGYIDLSAFKIYMSDIGLFTYKAKISVEDILSYFVQLNQYKGAVIENYVGQSLISNQYDIYYWESEGKAEIDYIIMKDNNIIPIEVKSSENTKSKSLDVYMKRYKPEYAIRISTKNFRFDNNIKSVPLYAVFAI